MNKVQIITDKDVDKEGTFECPNCRSRLIPDTDSHVRCGEVFKNGIWIGSRIRCKMCGTRIFIKFPDDMDKKWITIQLLTITIERIDNFRRETMIYD